MPARRGVSVLLISALAMTATVAAAIPAYPAVAWPTSTGPLLAEVVTGGASASDEYVEIADAGTAEVDLDGCELVYVTASGSSTTRKASFSSATVLEPGQHLLVANSAGIYAAAADATYSGGLAADGGALALRHVDGTVIDAVGWGSAANAYVEGEPAPAPPAKSSIERRPGGAGGNRQDTNDNLADWLLQSSPVPQSLDSGPRPNESPTLGPTAAASTTPGDSDAPTGSPTDSATPGDSTSPLDSDAPTDSPTNSAAPGESDGPTDSAAPGESDAPTSAPGPSAISSIAGAEPSSTVPASAAVSPSAAATASPPPVPETIALARTLPVGTHVHVVGVGIAEPGFVGADGLFAIQDSTAGIFVRLSAPLKEAVMGREVDVEGTLSAPYGQLEIRDVDSVSVGVEATPVVARDVAVADVGEASEGSLARVAGTVTSVTTDSGRITVTLTAGPASVHLLADPPSGLTSSEFTRGTSIVATGVVGQRASATGRLDGYRVWLRSPADVTGTGGVATSTPAASPSPTATPLDLDAVLGTKGAAVDVVATVTATAGLLDLAGPTIVVDDGTAAVAVILPEGAPAPRVGARVRVVGKVGRWETGPTVLATSVTSLGASTTLDPEPTTGPLDATLEWRLIRVCGRIDQFVRAGSRWRVDMTVDGHQVSALGEPAAAITVDKTAVGRLAVVTGIVRRSTSDSGVFQLLPRSEADFLLAPAPPASAGSPATDGPEAVSGDNEAAAMNGSVAIAWLASYLGRVVTVAGLVTATGIGTATIDDGTGAARLGGDAAAEELALLEPGDAIEATGLVTQDDLGFLIDVDPASVISLAAAAAATPAGDNTSAAPPSPAPRATYKLPAVPVAIRDVSAGSSLPIDAIVGLVVATLVGLAAGAVAAARRRGRFDPRRAAARRPAVDPGPDPG